MQALTKKKINVFGGNQTRPNINIHDMVNVYKHFLKNKEIESGFFNAGFENISILDIAKKVQKKIPSEIIVTSSNDPRSYRQNSDKLIGTGFSQNYTIENAIDEIIEKFRSGALTDKDIYYNIKMMKKIL
tara:strand:- start:130 stop:519 length:390 start_codon:yes stop_codon:yes gene_type:complete